MSFKKILDSIDEADNSIKEKRKKELYRLNPQDMVMTFSCLVCYELQKAVCTRDSERARNVLLGFIELLEDLLDSDIHAVKRIAGNHKKIDKIWETYFCKGLTMEKIEESIALLRGPNPYIMEPMINIKESCLKAGEYLQCKKLKRKPNGR